jgi:hypothetical protein
MRYRLWKLWFRLRYGFWAPPAFITTPILPMCEDPRFDVTYIGELWGIPIGVDPKLPSGQWRIMKREEHLHFDVDDG